MSSLPSIHQNKNRSSGSPVKHSRGRLSHERPNVTPVDPNSQRPMRFMTQHEKELLKAEEIKQQQPFLKRFATAEYRNSYLHNICVRMLKEGFHKSFDELFTLNSKRNQERLEAGPDSIIWEEQPLDKQHRKVDEICNYLTNAEYAARLGEIEEACRHMLEFYQLTTGRLWSDESDTNLHHISCHHMCRIYLTLARRSSDKAETLAYLHKAFDISKEGENKLQQAGIAYELGRDYEAANDSETAIKGNYGESIRHFSDSYDVMQEIREEIDEDDRDSNEDLLMLEECALQLGVAKGNQMLEDFAGNMEIAERQMMERIIDWKDDRTNDFGKPLPKLSTPPVIEPEKIPDPTEPFRMSYEDDTT